MKALTGFWTLVWREIYRFLSVISQTVIPPLVSSFLFILIFGCSLGSQIQQVKGVSYLEFLIPGLVMMHVIEGSYTNTSSSLFISRWANYIEELLVTPLSYFEMVLAILLGGLVRSAVTAAGVYAVSLFFVRFPVVHPVAVLFFLVLVSLIFSAAGMVVALFAEEWEHLTIATTFVITPLVFLGGVFHSSDMVPPALRAFTVWNPMFYMINGMRYSMLGTSDVPAGLCAGIVLVIFFALFAYTVYLFRTGFKLRK
ncbi:MAG TPA: ABC transporter permease [Verrucomicrobiae bacterium]|nr:ABC transporter permease [Verrucomicrobiae bacterium]